MEQTLKNLWEKFKKLVWWKKILVFLPLIVALLALVFVVGCKKSLPDSNVSYAKNLVDKQVEKNILKDKELADKDAEIAHQQEEIKHDIKVRTDEAVSTANSISDATGDPTALLRLHRELNEKRKHR